MDLTLLILAAGMGSRYGGLKQIDSVGPSQEAIIDYSIYDAIKAGFNKVVFVIRKNFETEFKSVFDEKLKGKINVEYVFQELNEVTEGIKKSLPKREKPWGTAHAILVAKSKINEPFIAINADDYYGPSAYKVMSKFLLATYMYDNMHGMIGYKLKNTLSDFGTVSRGVCSLDENDFLRDIYERKQVREKDDRCYYFDHATNMQKALQGNEYASMNFWGFKPSVFEHLQEHFIRFVERYGKISDLEFYIPSFVNSLILQKKVRVKMLESKDRWFGITYKEDKAEVENKITALIEKGVYPKKLWGE